tara:strand:+ start:291 stop:626 length:336 start_codon:yes stop_codon:yes gene_type:complete
MDILRQYIRYSLLQENLHHFEKLAELLSSKSLINVNQGIELGEAMDYLTVVKTRDFQDLDKSRLYYIQPTPAFGEFVKGYITKHNLDSINHMSISKDPREKGQIKILRTTA